MLTARSRHRLRAVGIHKLCPAMLHLRNRSPCIVVPKNMLDIRYVCSLEAPSITHILNIRVSACTCIARQMIRSPGLDTTQYARVT